MGRRPFGLRFIWLILWVIGKGSVIGPRKVKTSPDYNHSFGMHNPKASKVFKVRRD